MPLFIVRMLDLKIAAMPVKSNSQCRRRAVQQIVEIEVDAPNQYRAESMAWDALAKKNLKEDPHARYVPYGIVEKK